MKVPLAWLRDYVDIDLPTEELARRLTFAGLEVEGIRYVGVAPPTEGGATDGKREGLAWDRDRVVVAAVREVRPHPDADRLVLVDVDAGGGIETAVTGAPNLFPYRDRGPLERPLPVAYAREGARLFDGHRAGQHPMTLKRAKIRGVESSSMVLSEKELGISDEHEGIILLDDDGPAPGTPLVDLLGDVVLDISITPNMARNACILGVAREVAALTGAPLRPPPLDVEMTGPPIAGRLQLELREPRFNPRFTASLLEGIAVGPSPYWLRLRLRLAGMRPINNVVDVTNYVMLELGQPLHAFDYDILLRRAQEAGAEVPTVVTRLAAPGERLTTLDGVDRRLDDFTILVTDAAGVLSLGGVMGGAESEVSDATTRVLLEAAAWEMINIRRTVQAQQLQSSEAGYRFSRGVHPEQALRGNRRALELMRRMAGGEAATGILDEYPSPAAPVSLELPLSELERLLGIIIPKETVVDILESLELAVEDRGSVLAVTVPDHRVDIEPGVVGVADLVEEVARIYGYERIPETQIADTIPPQRGNPGLELEQRVRDLLVTLGFQEIITYHLTSRDADARLDPAALEPDVPYVTLANPINVDRAVLRRSLLPGVLEVVAANARHRERQALFEIGKVYLPKTGEALPEEPRRLTLVATGPREPASWLGGDDPPIGFFDLKGLVEELTAALRVAHLRFESGEGPGYHPGRTARLLLGDGTRLGLLGELHQQQRARYDLPDAPVLAAELDLDALLAASPERHATTLPPRFPSVLEDLAVVVDEGVPAARVHAAIVAGGGRQLEEARLFDRFRGDQVGEGKTSLAYRLVYRSAEGTLTDADARKIRQRILRRLEKDTGAILRT